MKRNGPVLLLVRPWALAVLSVEGRAANGADTRPVALVERQSGEGVERFSRSSQKTDLSPLSNHFISRDNSIFCGPISSAIVLNALRLGRKDGLPKDRQSIAKDELAWLTAGTDPFYGKYASNNVLSERTKSRQEILGKSILVQGDAKSEFGLPLGRLAQVLRSHGLEVVTRLVDDGPDIAPTGREIAANLARRDGHVPVNDTRRGLDQMGGSHISPLGAYDEASDSFLIMDVNPNRASWVWVKADDLIATMRSFDTVENRGYLPVSEGEWVGPRDMFGAMPRLTPGGTGRAGAANRRGVTPVAAERSRDG